jgi:hypothetical protein
VIGRLRDRFWRAFWLRQQKYLPPAARLSFRDVKISTDKDSTVPAIHVQVGREWKR